MIIKGELHLTEFEFDILDKIIESYNRNYVVRIFDYNNKNLFESNDITIYDSINVIELYNYIDCVEVRYSININNINCISIYNNNDTKLVVNINLKKVL